MKILAIDSSGMTASVAITEDDKLTAEYTVDYKKTHSQTLLPMLDEVKKMTELDLSSLDAIAVAAGPGSFTGLRIGSATAKGLAEALNKPIIEVPTLDAMAYNVFGCEDVICPMLDARRGQVYTGFYTFQREETSKTGFVFHVIREQFAEAADKVMLQLNEIGRPVLFLGDGVPVSAQTIAESLRTPRGFAPASCSRQRAASVAVLAGQLYREGKTVKAWEHKPEYLRMSQAERERLEKEGQKTG